MTSHYSLNGEVKETYNIKNKDLEKRNKIFWRNSDNKKEYIIGRDGPRSNCKNDETTSDDVKTLGERIRNTAPTEESSHYSDCREKIEKFDEIEKFENLSKNALVVTVRGKIEKMQKMRKGKNFENLKHCNTTTNNETKSKNKRTEKTTNSDRSNLRTYEQQYEALNKKREIETIKYDNQMLDILEGKTIKSENQSNFFEDDLATKVHEHMEARNRFNQEEISIRKQFNKEDTRNLKECTQTRGEMMEMAINYAMYQANDSIEAFLQMDKKCWNFKNEKFDKDLKYNWEVQHEVQIKKLNEEFKKIKGKLDTDAWKHHRCDKKNRLDAKNADTKHRSLRTNENVNGESETGCMKQVVKMERKVIFNTDSNVVLQTLETQNGDAPIDPLNKVVVPQITQKEVRKLICRQRIYITNVLNDSGANTKIWSSKIKNMEKTKVKITGVSATTSIDAKGSNGIFDDIYVSRQIGKSIIPPQALLEEAKLKLEQDVTLIHLALNNKIQITLGIVNNKINAVFGISCKDTNYIMRWTHAALEFANVDRDTYTIVGRLNSELMQVDVKNAINTVQSNHRCVKCEIFKSMIDETNSTMEEDAVLTDKKMTRRMQTDIAEIDLNETRQQLKVKLMKQALMGQSQKSRANQRMRGLMENPDLVPIEDGTEMDSVLAKFRKKRKTNKGERVTPMVEALPFEFLLVDYISFSNINTSSGDTSYEDGNKYIGFILVVDLVSRMSWVAPIRKQKQDFSGSLRNILNEIILLGRTLHLRPKPRAMIVDMAANQSKEALKDIRRDYQSKEGSSRLQ